MDSEARHAGVKFEIYESGECGWFDKGGGPNWYARVLAWS